jgi:putative two-component system response regulator
MPKIVSEPVPAGADLGSRGAPAGISRVDSLDELVDVAVEPTLAVALRGVREMLGMEVAYLSVIADANTVLRELDGDGESFGLRKGLLMPREDTYCQRMLDGRIPNLLPDVRADDRTASLALTNAASIGAFATMPLTFADGRLYGTLCAANHEPKVFGDRELRCLRVFARLIADQLEREEAALVVSRLAALLDATDDAIIGVTPAGIVIGWNAASERTFGYPASEAIGRDIVELIASPGEEEGIRRGLARVTAGQIVRRQSRRQRADGTAIYDAVTLSPIRDEDGQVTLISAVFRDITDAVVQTHHGMVERQVVKTLQAAGTANEAALAMLQGVGEGLDCEIGVLWEPGENATRLRCSSLWISPRSTGLRFAQTMCDDSFAPGEELPGRIWESGEDVWFEGLGRIVDSPRAAAAAASGLRTAVGLAFRSGGRIVGVVEFFSRNETPLNAEMLAMGEALVGRLADAIARHRAEDALRDANHALEIRVRERTIDLRRVVAELDAAQIETVRRLSRAVEFRDQDTGAHIARISAFAALIARSAGLDAEHCGLIERASPLHDVGKVAIPDSVLLKPGPLTPAERSVIETHAETGHRLLEGSDSAVLQLAATIALTHHEHYDGGGYPRGLTGEGIPIEGRIVAIADVFDALTSDRVYRPAMTFDQAVAILRQGRGTQFDPVLLDLFLTDLNETLTETRTAPSSTDHP